MRKLIFGMAIALIAVLTVILLISKGRSTITEELYYTIPKIYSYFYTQDKKMNFNIYSNNAHSFISLSEKNTYTLLCEKNQYQLKDIQIAKEIDSEIKNECYYKYNLEIPLLSFSSTDIILENCSLEVKNEHFTLTCFLGDIYIYRKDYIPLDFSDLYGNYTYYEKELHFIGFTIALNKDYKNLEDIRMGKAYSFLNFIEMDTLYDSERIVERLPYPLVSSKPTLPSFPLNAKENYYYIPIAYEKLYLIQEASIVLQIDGKMYYIPDFLFLANDISLKDYPITNRQGTFQNA